MRTVLLASLRHNTRRYVASALAVIIGVAFIVATDGLSGALRSGMTADVAQPYERASHVVATTSTDEAESLLSAADAEGIAASPNALTWASMTTGNLTSNDVTLGVAPSPADLRWQTLVAGSFPQTPGEVLITESVAARHHLAVGDTFTYEAMADEAVEARVAGVVETTHAGGSDVYLPWEDLAQIDGVYVESVLWDGPVDAAVAIVDEANVMTTAAHVAALQQEITRGVDVIALLVSVFAAIALGVAILVITNTFAILFAQRARDFALLRCVGVTRRQLRRSVRVEALVLGVVASLVGVASGVLVAYASSYFIGRSFDEFGSASYRWWWMASAALIGVGVTVVAAWLPTRAVTRISPLAALRPAEGFDARTRAGRVRLAFATLFAALGTAGLVVAVRGDELSVALPLMFASGGAAFVGLLLAGPLLVPALLRVFGRLLTRPGAAGSVPRLASSNARRNPRRTATTTASLMVGVTLTTAVLTGLGTIVAAMDDEMARDYPVDVAVMPTEMGALPEGLAERVEAAEGVRAVGTLPGATVSAGGGQWPILGLGADRSFLHGGQDPFADGQIQIPYEIYNELSDRARREIDEKGRLSLRSGENVLTLTADVSGAYGPTLVVPVADLERLAPGAGASALWVRAQDGVDADELDTAINGALAGADVEVTGRYAQRAWVEVQMRVVTGAVVGLLAVAVVIALIGIANTLGLSVLERTRESALLRAMGLTRAQLRRTLAVEGFLFAAVATVLGVAVGLVFAWVGVQVMFDDLVDTTFTVPWWQVAILVAAALVSGVLASVMPSRRAARVSPAAGLALE